MSFLKKISIAGAVLGASMMLASSAGATIVTVSGALSDVSNNSLVDNTIVGDGQLFPQVSLADNSALVTGLSDAFAPNDGSDGGGGELWFEFVNTSAENLFFKARANDILNGFIGGFRLTWMDSAKHALTSTPIGLPSPDGTTLDITAAQGVVYYLVATWDSAFALDDGNDGFSVPIVGFSVSTASSGNAPSTVPLPPSLVLFGSGLLGLGFLSARRRRKATSV